MISKSLKESDTCSVCKNIPMRVDEKMGIEKYRSMLIKISGFGKYYRGEEYQLSEYKILKCPECEIYYEDAHHYYSDPESTMGLARDEDDWFILTRLDEKTAEKLLNDLNT